MHRDEFMAEQPGLRCRFCQTPGELETRLNPRNNGLAVVCPTCRRFDPLGIGGYLSRAPVRRDPMESPRSYEMPFGKYKGQSVESVPDQALTYYLNWDQLRPETRKILEAERARRGAAPDPQPELALGPDTHAVALDLVAAGEAALLRQHPGPGQTRMIRAAAAALRDRLGTPAPPPDDEVPF